MSINAYIHGNNQNTHTRIYITKYITKYYHNAHNAKKKVIMKFKNIIKMSFCSEFLYSRKLIYVIYFL